MKLIPTMNLRFAMRYVPLYQQGDSTISQMRAVLQQQFDLPSGGSVWRDVPEVVEEDRADD